MKNFKKTNTLQGVFVFFDKIIFRIESQSGSIFWAGLVVGMTLAFLVFFISVNQLFFAPVNDSRVILPSRALSFEDISVASLPDRIVIPKIGLDAKINSVGQTETGNMAAPENFKDVGWYEYGSVPGVKGSAVLAGHLDDRFGLPAVFDRLEELEPGDEVFIKNVSGRMLRFVVLRSKLFDYETDSTEEIFNTNNKAYLNLITCGGSWVRNKRVYDKRLVVFTAYKPE